jgi:hypothetical protein
LKGNERRSTRDGGSRGIAAWLHENRDEILKQVVAGLIVAALIAGVGLMFAVSRVPLVVLVIALPLAIVFGAYWNARSQRRQERIPDFLVPEIEKGVRLRVYFEQMRHLMERGLGEGIDLEQELLVKPARLIEEMTGRRIHLLILEPTGTESGSTWNIRFRAGISDGECREFEVPLRDSYIALKLRRGGTDMVFRLDDMHESQRSTRAPGADVDAFQRAGFRVVKFVRSEVPDSPNEVTSCLVLLSREEELPNGTEDALLMLLSRCISIHFELTGMGKQVKAAERRIAELEP